MRVLVIGAKGMLGHDVVETLRASGYEPETADRADFDIADPDAVTSKLLGGERFDWCINCAAYTAVDAAETDVDEATRANALGPGLLARACAISGTRMVHVSTDFVFDGQKGSAYTEEDAPNPLNVYGRTKLEGEEAVLSASPNAIVLRTSWLFGAHGKSFPRQVIRAARAGVELKVVRDQIGTPTSTVDLATVIVRCIQEEVPGGLYHVAGSDAVSWYELARVALDANVDTRGYPMQGILSWEWPTAAQRPRYSALACPRLDLLGITPLRPLTETISEFVTRLQP